jgi:hypothetical protein
VDDEAIASSENLLLTFRDVRNEAGKGNDIFNQATAAILDMSVAMGTDLNSATIQVGKALNDPIRGITALTRVGVTFTDKQKDVIAHLVETGHKAEAQKLILEELRKEFEGSAKAAGSTLAGQLNKLTNAFDEAAGQMVSVFIPALTTVAEKFTGFIDNFARAKGFTAKLKIVWLGVREAARDLMDNIRDALFGFRKPLKLKSGQIIEWEQTQGLVKELTTALKRVDWTEVGKTIGEGISSRVRITAAFLNDALEQMSTWIDAHVDQLAEIGLKIVLTMISKLSDPQFWKENWALILAVAVTVFPVGKLGSLGGKAAKAFGGQFARFLPEGVRTAVARALPVLGRITGWLSGVVRPALAKIPGWFRAAFKLSFVLVALSAVRGAVESVREAVRRATDFMREKWSHVPGPIRTVVGVLISVWTWLNNIVGAVRDLISWIGRIHFPSPPSWLRSAAGALGIGATGGIVTRPTLSLIGERGPEAVVPLSRTPGSRPLPAMAGGGGRSAGRFLVLTDAEGVAFLQSLNQRHARGNGGRSIW